MIALLLTMALAAPCRERQCARDGDVTACTCLAGDEGAYVVTIRRGGKLLYRGVREFPTFGRAPILLLRRDLDGDGHREIVAADFAGASNGMAVESWNLTIVDGKTNAATVTPSSDFSAGLVRDRSVLITSWEWIGEHLYFVWRPYAYAGGALHPDKAHGMWRRRFLNSFARQRAAGKGTPAQWIERAEHVAWTDPTPRQ